MSLSFWIRTFFFLHQIFGFLDFFLELFSKLVVRFLYFLSLWFLNCCFWFSDLVYNDKDVSHSSLSHDHHGHNPDNLSVKDIPDLDVALEEKSSWVVPTVVHNLVMIIMMIMMMMLLLMMLMMIIMIKTMTMMKREWWEWLANISYLDQKEFIAWSKGGRDLWNINIRWIFSRFSKKNI